MCRFGTPHFLEKRVLKMILYGILTVLIIAVDQIIKHIVSNQLSFGEVVTVVPNVLSLTYMENRGAAFGILQDKQTFFIVIGVLIVLIFGYIIVANKINNKMFFFSAALIVGGGIGNLIDRTIHGYVIDYLQRSFFSPVCNLADYCITVGTVLLVIYLLFYSDKTREASMQIKKEK